MCSAVAAAMLFTRRNLDAWIPTPKTGWGMLPLVMPPKEKDGAKHCVAPRACALVKELRKAAELRKAEEALMVQMAVRVQCAWRGKNGRVAYNLKKQAMRQGF